MLARHSSRAVYAVLLASVLLAVPASASSAGADAERGQAVPMQAWTAAPNWAPPSSPLDGPIVGTEAKASNSSRNSLGVAPLAALPSVLPLTTIAPCRQYDSRSTSSLADNTPRAVTLTGAPCGIPTTAQAVSVNITVFSITGAGSNGVFKVDTVSPPASAWINYPPTETQRANAGTVALNGSGAIVVQVNQGAGSVDFVVDVNGYYAPLNTPYFGGTESFGALTAGNGYIYNAIGVNIGNSTKCMVTITPLVDASFTTNFPAESYTAWRVNGTTVNNVYPSLWCFLAPALANSYYSCTQTAIFLPTGSLTNTYDFGCNIRSNGNATGGYCHTTVMCFP
jgi:hypothetical protein